MPAETFTHNYKYTHSYICTDVHTYTHMQLDKYTTLQGAAIAAWCVHAC